MSVILLSILFLIVFASLGVTLYYTLMPNQKFVDQNYKCLNVSSCTGEGDGSEVKCDSKTKIGDCNDIEGCKWHSNIVSYKDDDEPFRKKERFAPTQIPPRTMMPKKERFAPTQIPPRTMMPKKERFADRCSA